LIKSESRLSLNLDAPELEGHLRVRLAAMGGRRADAHTVLCLDRSDLHNEYAQMMDLLAKVRDSRTGELHNGYWPCDITAAELRSSEIVRCIRNCTRPMCKRSAAKMPNCWRRWTGCGVTRGARHLGDRSRQGSARGTRAPPGATGTLRHPVLGEALRHRSTSSEGKCAGSGG